MKAERRHELQTNDLADLLTHGFEKHRQHLPTAMWGVVAIIAVIMALTLWSTRRGTSQLQAWEEFDHIRYTDGKARPKHLKELIERYPNTEVALWTQLDLADQLCSDGRDKIPIEREIANTYLKEAQQNYAAVLQNPSTRPDMIRRAALADAKCWELIGDREKAIASYERTAETYKNLLPELAATAKQYAANLSQPEAADFYKWLAEYKPPLAPTSNFPNLSPNFPPLGTDKEIEQPASATTPEKDPDNSRPNSDEQKASPDASTTSEPPSAQSAPGESPKKVEPEDSAKPE